VAGSLIMMSSSKDPVISSLSDRLRNRRLFKCIDIRESLNQKLRMKESPKSKRMHTSTSTAASEAGNSAEARMLRIDALDKTSDRTEKRLLRLMRKTNGESPKVLLDKGERSIYKTIEESKGPLNQIMILPGTGTNIPVDVASASQVINAIAPFKFLRVYIADGEQKAKQQIERIITEEAEKCHS
jgi:hypothetical protein